MVAARKSAQREQTKITITVKGLRSTTGLLRNRQGKVYLPGYSARLGVRLRRRGSTFVPLLLQEEGLCCAGAKDLATEHTFVYGHKEGMRCHGPAGL